MGVCSNKEFELQEPMEDSFKISIPNGYFNGIYRDISDKYLFHGVHLDIPMHSCNLLIYILFT